MQPKLLKYILDIESVIQNNIPELAIEREGINRASYYNNRNHNHDRYLTTPIILVGKLVTGSQKTIKMNRQ